MEQQDVRYVSSLYGGFWSFDIKDFCYMTNPYFPPQEFIDSMGSRLRELVKSYPSTNWYLSSLAAGPLGITHEELVIANGPASLSASSQTASWNIWQFRYPPLMSLLTGLSPRVSG